MKKKHVVERMCLNCRTRFPKREMIRLVEQDGSYALDQDGKGGGRGSYLCRSEACLSQALGDGKKKRALSLSEAARSLLRREVERAAGKLKSDQASISKPRTLSLTEEEKIMRMLGLAKRAGHYSPGQDASLAAASCGKLSLMLVASDASASAVEKWKKKLEEQSVPYMVFADKLRLGQSLGRGPTAFCGITDMNLAQGMLEAVNCRELTNSSETLSQ